MIISKLPTPRRDIFKQRFRGKLDDYKKKTGRSMKELADYMRWSETEYQWLRRAASKGVSQAHSKKKQLTQLAKELDTSLEYLFGDNDSAELPTWERSSPWSSKHLPNGNQKARSTPTRTTFAGISQNSCSRRETQRGHWVLETG